MLLQRHWIKKRTIKTRLTQYEPIHMGIWFVLYRSVAFLWVQGGVRIMAARDNLLVMYVTVTLLVVTLQKN